MIDLQNKTSQPRNITRYKSYIGATADLLLKNSSDEFSHITQGVDAIINMFNKLN